MLLFGYVLLSDVLSIASLVYGGGRVGRWEPQGASPSGGHLGVAFGWEEGTVDSIIGFLLWDMILFSMCTTMTTFILSQIPKPLPMGLPGFGLWLSRNVG